MILYNINIKKTIFYIKGELNMVKSKLKNITDTVEIISKKVYSIMHNRLIIAVFMIVDGICFIIDPTNKMEFTSQMVALSALLASFAVLTTNISSKKRNLKYIILAIIIIIICIYLLIFPKILAINLRVLFAIFIILNGLINIFNIIKLDRLSNYISNTEDKLKNKFEEGETAKTFNNGAILEETEKFINPFEDFIEKSSKNSILYFILNIISVILGIVLFTNNNITLILCGLILIYTGISDLLMFIKSMKLSKRLK